MANFKVLKKENGTMTIEATCARNAISIIKGLATSKEFIDSASAIKAIGFNTFGGFYYEIPKEDFSLSTEQLEKKWINFCRDMLFENHFFAMAFEEEITLLTHS